MASEPKTLQEAIVYFSDPDNCLNYIAARRWKHGVTCPTCGSKDVGFVASRKVWQCKTRHPKSQFTVKVGTVMEDSPIGLDKWLTVMWMVSSMKNGVSSWEIHRSLGVTQKTAWFLLHRVRLAMQGKNAGKLGGGSGQVEVDETYIGGAARNMHSARKKRVLQGKGGGVSGKVGVQGTLERGGEIRLNVIRDSQYTNGLENFWSLLKRNLSGTYVCVEPFHLFRYLDEQAFRYNNRKDMNDSERFSALVSQVVGKRLTYAELTGKTGQQGEETRF